MNKPSTIWVIATLCVIIVLTAFGVVTNRMIQKDVQHSQQIVDAHREGRIRLAMWRLDTLAASIIANEDERSVYEFTNPENDEVATLNPALAVNPLYYRTPKTTNLYWNLEPTGLNQVDSPQVYNTDYLMGNSIPTDNNTQNRGQLEELKEILATKNDWVPISNGMVSCQAAHVSLDNWGANNLTNLATEINEQDFSYNDLANSSIQQVEEIINAPTEQQKLTLADKGSRQKAVSRMNSFKRTQSWNNNIQHNKEKLNVEKEDQVDNLIKTLSSKKKSNTESDNTTKSSPKEGIDKQKTSPSISKAKIQTESKTKSNPNLEPFSEQAVQAINNHLAPLQKSKFSERPDSSSSNTAISSNLIDTAHEEPFSTPFTPLWLNDELMLVRKVNEPERDSVQGVWLNKEVIISKLLSEIKDLFPHAELVPVNQDIKKILNRVNIKGNETTMLSIPLQLLHNDFQTVQATPTDYIFGPIGLAWLGAILAIGAFYYMLKSVLKMAERRASFVSSVTHELRTPLTTFRLYSDLLSSGMVTDEEKQKSYLNTLKLESERLTHLVENVLSYSQIEKGNAKAKVEPISLYQFIQRIEPRLNERATEEDMIVNTIFSESSAEEILQIDATGVEQIVFNLIDNACKYASAENHGREITLVAEVTNRKLNIKVCDQGDGIARSEQKRLFRPFHKSAKEAAHTKPGVGLGLALCKRLAKAMHGDLTIAKNTNTKGACFQLTLPR